MRRLSQPGPSTMRALVVDDCPVTRALLGGALQRLGFEVSEAEHAHAALGELEQTHAPDLILLDLYMPGMDGFELMQTMRRNNRYDQTVILVVSCDNELSHIERALQLGADEYLMKPLSQRELYQKLTLLGHSEVGG